MDRDNVISLDHYRRLRGALAPAEHRRRECDERLFAAPGPECRREARALFNELEVSRTGVLTAFCRAAGLGIYEAPPTLEARAGVLRRLCDRLIDYIAMGQFNFYVRIADHGQDGGELLRFAEELYPRIARTTDSALAFYDRYNTGLAEADGPELHRDLSRLGEMLAERIEVEDMLSRALYLACEQ